MDAVTMERGRATQGANLCSRLVYRSRATKALDGAGLADLVEAAQARNARENVTGCLVYDSGHFLQWLEGPGDGIDRIASSIRMDKRHDDIEVLDEAWTEKRVFSDWSMRLVVGHGVNDMNGAVAASDALIERLHRPPNPIQDLAELLRPHPLCGTALRDCREEAFNHGRLRERRGLMVRPKLVTADNVATAKAVDGALGGDVDRVCEALRPRIFESCLAARTVAQLLECVMEAIRIKWLDDAIWEYEATLA
ncbi:MAG: BLUF domain-containing protein, partial [Pseudomonadota bacterium]